MAARSPLTLAHQIREPVFLAPVARTSARGRTHQTDGARMKGAGVPVESLYSSNEGNGFYTEPHRCEYDTRVLALLSKQLGGGTAN
ncbi:putative prolyl oligopeptidase family protein [Xanthomonas citri pv. fuscans]|nr:putative prolyl oligopeptidase family protein [Xanthomonas citri pv. fuscans]